MSLKRNIAANYLSQGYATLIGIVMVPFYIRFMGIEAYGLVGFFSMMQAWFALLDVGLTPTVVRETARFRGGSTDAMTFRRLVRALEGVFLSIALLGGAALYLSSSFIAKDWLHASQLPISEVKTSLELIAWIIAVRWMIGLYHGVIIGSERMVWLGGYNAIMATMRFIVILPILMFIGATPTIFFVFQFFVALIEFAVISHFAYEVLPKLPKGTRLPWAWAPLKPVLRFSLTIAFTSAAGVLVTQTDKLVLSKIIPLADYGCFALAILVAGGILIMSAPISSAVLPRLTKLEAEGNDVGLITLYRQATQLVAVVAGATSITIALCAEPLLLTWTGDKVLAQQAAPILILYALGNGILVVAGFPYYLQYAKGDLRLHVIGNALFVVLLIPLIIWAANNYGGVGAGYVWLGMNVLIFLAWVPLVHRRFVPGLNLKWYGQDTLLIFAASTLVGLVLSFFLPQNENRLTLFFEILGVGFLVMLTAAVSASFVREKARIWLEAAISKNWQNG